MTRRAFLENPAYGSPITTVILGPISNPNRRMRRALAAQDRQKEKGRLTAPLQNPQDISKNFDTKESVTP